MGWGSGFGVGVGFWAGVGARAACGLGLPLPLAYPYGWAHGWHVVAHGIRGKNAIADHLRLAAGHLLRARAGAWGWG